MNVVVNPATEETIAELPEATAADADRAVAAAQSAYPAWRALDGYSEVKNVFVAT